MIRGVSSFHGVLIGGDRYPTHNLMEGAMACMTNRQASVSFHGRPGLHMLL